jgi:hypothetical protein
MQTRSLGHRRWSRLHRAHPTSARSPLHRGNLSRLRWAASSLTTVTVAQGSTIKCGNGTERRPSGSVPGNAGCRGYDLYLFLIRIRIWVWTRRLLYRVFLSGLLWLLALILDLHGSVPFRKQTSLVCRQLPRASLDPIWAATSRRPAEPLESPLQEGSRADRSQNVPWLVIDAIAAGRLYAAVPRYLVRQSFWAHLSCIGMPAAANGNVVESTQVAALTTPNVQRRNRQRTVEVDR